MRLPEGSYAAGGIAWLSLLKADDVNRFSGVVDDFKEHLTQRHGPNSRQSPLPRIARYINDADEQFEQP